MSTDSKEEFKYWYTWFLVTNQRVPTFIEAYESRQPEIDAIKAKAKRSLMQNDAWWTGKLYTQDENVKLKEENAALKAEVERLRKDAERLDELAKPGISLHRNDDPEPDDDDLFAVFRVTGYPNDREWTELGRGGSVRE